MTSPSTPASTPTQTGRTQGVSGVTSQSASTSSEGFGPRANGSSLSAKPIATISSTNPSDASSVAAAGTSNDESKRMELGKRNWKRVQARLRAELGEDIYSSWFSSAMLEKCDDGQVVLSVATKFLKHWIEHNFGPRLLELWAIEDESVERYAILVRTDAARRIAKFGSSSETQTTNGQPANTNHTAGAALSKTAGNDTTLSPKNVLARPGQIGVSASLGGRSSTKSVRGDSTANPSTNGASTHGTPLDNRYTFNAFAVGDSNQFAYRAARELAREGSVLGCKVLFVRGGVGLGKTHLCQAVAHEMHAANRRTLYLTAEQFMRDFVISLRARSAVEYKEALAAIDVLVVDDIQFLSGPVMQGEFCHVINTLIDAGKTLVVAADRPPAALDTIDVRMQSRLSSGLVVEIAAMDRTVRRALLERRRANYLAEGGKADVSDAVLDKVSDLITTNGRDLEGAFNRIIAEIGLNNAPVTEQSVVSCISFLLSNTEAPRVKIEDIQRATALQFGLTKTDLLSHRRTKQIVGPRQIAMYLAKMMTVRSLPDIGRRFGGRDHTTVLHAVRKIEKDLQNDASLQKTVESLKSAILSQS
ncbi:MAG: chromosomal replication initiator protein DnaA [Devosiaceae bacterium]